MPILRTDLYRRLLAAGMSAAVVLSASFTLNSAWAQEATPDATTGDTANATAIAIPAEATQDSQADQSATVTEIVRFRLAHFIAGGPNITTYVDGELSDIQVLSYPAVTGWIELPGSNVQFSFVPEGGTPDQAVASPVTLDATGGFATLALVGTATDPQAILINEPIGLLAETCARVTVFNALEGSEPFDIGLDDGTVIGTGIGFPGGASGASTAEIDTTDLFSGACVNTGAAAAAGAEGTQEAGTVTTATTTTAGASANLGALQCIGLPITAVVSAAASDATSGIEGTQEAGQASTTTSTTTSTARGSTFQNCGYVFDIPSGARTIQFNTVGTTGGTLLTLPSTQFNPNSYTFIALIGTEDAPQPFIFTVNAALLGGVLENAQSQ